MSGPSASPVVLVSLWQGTRRERNPETRRDLAADVVGYSRLAGMDEDCIFARRCALRGDLSIRAITVHQGRVVKRAGAGAWSNSAASSTLFIFYYGFPICRRSLGGPFLDPLCHLFPTFHENSVFGTAAIFSDARVCVLISLGEG
jgi:class 3 adenylate cyclase